MKRKQQERRLHLLCGEQGINILRPGEKPFSIIEERDKFKIYANKDNANNKMHQYLYKRLEICDLFVILGYTDQEAYDYWTTTNFERFQQRKQYDLKPIPIRKDNPNTYGEPFVGFGTKRQPKKIRKTAWKRFIKLFPNHKII